MMGRGRSTLCILLCAWLWSCTTTPPHCDATCQAQQRQIDYIEANPQLADKIKQAIAHGRVVVGMSRADVVASLGEPDALVDVNASWAAREQWIYNAGTSTAEFYYFKFGKLNSWTTQRASN